MGRRREPEGMGREPVARRPKSPNPNFAKRTDSHLRQPKHNLARSVIFGLAIRNENPKAGAGSRRPKSPNPNFAKRTDSHLRQPKLNLARSARQFFLTERSHTPHKAPPTASARSVIFGLAIRNENPRWKFGMGIRGGQFGMAIWNGDSEEDSRVKMRDEVPKQEFGRNNCKK